MQRAHPKPISELRIQLPKGVTMAQKTMEQDERIDNLAGRVQTLENALHDLARFVHQGFTRGGLHEPTPADPEHDNARMLVTYECTNPGSWSVNAAGERVRAGGCGARTTREVAANASVPDDVTCPACGTIAHRVDTQEGEESAHTVRYETAAAE